MQKFARQKARKLALQALFQWQFTKDTPSYIEAQFLTTANPKKIDLPYFSTLLKETITNIEPIDTQITSVLDRPITNLNPLELAIIRLATFELHYLDTPYKVVINEALEMTKIFGSHESFKFVNGVLDKIAKMLHPS